MALVLWIFLWVSCFGQDVPRKTRPTDFQEDVYALLMPRFVLCLSQENNCGETRVGLPFRRLARRHFHVATVPGPVREQ